MRRPERPPRPRGDGVQHALLPVIRSVRAGALAVLACATAAAAQARAPASPGLPADHWAVAALGRLDALGLGGEGLDPGAGFLDRAEARRRFAAAAVDAATPGLARLAGGFAARLAAELGPGEGEGGGARIEALGELGYLARRGALLSGYDRDGVTYAPARLGPLTEPAARLEVDAVLGRHLAAVVRPEAAAGRVRLDGGYLALRAGALSAWAGRRDVAYGAEADRSIVLGGGVAFDGAGVTLGSARLPGLLAAAGPVRLEALGARLHEAGAVEHPAFLALRLWARPHPRLWLAATRAAAFDGRGNRHLRPGEIPGFLLGLAGGAHGETENQVASLEARWRPPTGGLPVAIYGEWAFDDLGFAWTHVPGVTAGVELPALPGAPAASLGLERTSLAGHCCGNPPWYRHSALPWIDGRVPLGHPLGGEGVQWLAYGRIELPRGIELAARAFHRRRGPENLFSPLRQGTSRGGSLDVEWVAPDGVVAFGSAALERGAGWRESALRAGIRVRAGALGAEKR